MTELKLHSKYNNMLYSWINKHIKSFYESLLSSKSITKIEFTVVDIYNQSHIGRLMNENNVTISSTLHFFKDNVNKSIVTSSNNNVDTYLENFINEVYKSLFSYYEKTNNKIICQLDERPSTFITNNDTDNECCPLLQNSQLLLEEIPEELLNLIIGVYPNDSSYNDKRFVYNKQLNYFPHAIYYPITTNDVSYLINNFFQYNLEFAIRCGGHSYEPASLSTGYVVDVTKLPQYIIVSSDRKTATISPGFRLGDLASELAKQNLLIVTGEYVCPGVSGISLMGGKGPLARLYGTMCDNIVDVKMINYKGELITANENENCDLFWATKGAGNGNFGVITEFTINVYEDIYFYQTTYQWNWNREESLIILQVYQDWILTISDNIWTSFRITYNNGIATISLKINKYSKIPLTEDEIFAALFDPTITKTNGYYIQNLNNFISGCNSPNNPFSKIKSSMIFEPIKQVGLLLLIESVETQLNNGYNILYELTFSQMGGEIKNGNSSYYPKDAISVLSYFIEWSNPEQSSQFTQFLNELYIKTEPYISFYCFANLIDYDIVDYMTKYYGTNKEKLIQIKQKYDPYNVFKSRQSIPIVN